LPSGSRDTASGTSLLNRLCLPTKLFGSIELRFLCLVATF
jgi:hypothetical protein